MISITKIFEFEASHNLPNHRGACHRLHGHSYKLEVTVTGTPQGAVLKRTGVEESNPEYGMVMDFKNLKDIVMSVIGKYDHCHLNEFFSNPTAETMVKSIAFDIMPKLPESVALVSCKLWETSTSYAEYNPFMDALRERLLKYGNQPLLKSAT